MFHPCFCPALWEGSVDKLVKRKRPISFSWETLSWLSPNGVVPLPAFWGEKNIASWDAPLGLICDISYTSERVGEIKSDL